MLTEASGFNGHFDGTTMVAPMKARPAVRPRGGARLSVRHLGSKAPRMQSKGTKGRCEPDSCGRLSAGRSHYGRLDVSAGLDAKAFRSFTSRRVRIRLSVRARNTAFNIIKVADFS
jgi:hypothetical protein